MSEQGPSDSASPDSPPPDANVDVHAATLARLDALETKLTQESKARAVEMATQEHRLIPAVAAWLRAALTRPFDAERFSASSQALVWCLIPSPATATISLVSVLGLVVALQANRFLMLQTERMEEQNMLAEAQRRASLVIEATSLFEQIEKEKDALKPPLPPVLCDGILTSACFNGKLFVPSEATMGRLAALTQALRPYRYLVVDPREAAQPCDAIGEVTGPASISNALFAQLLATSALNLDQQTASAVIERELQNRDGVRLPGRLEGAWQWLSERIAPARTAARLSCTALSPERGQLLGSLHAARIDLSALAQRGATFELADLPDQSNLHGIVLKGVNLSGASLRGAQFTKAVLDSVDFEGADLTGARFASACLAYNNLGGAQLETLGKQSIARLELTGSVPLFFLPQHLSFGDQLDSVWVRYQNPSDGFDRFCATLNTMETRVSPDSTEPLVAEQALVLSEHLRQHWVVEVTGLNWINGAALLRPDALARNLADVGLGKPSLTVARNGALVRIFAMRNCPVPPAREPDAQADALLAKELQECKQRLQMGEKEPMEPAADHEKTHTQFNQ